MMLKSILVPLDGSPLGEHALPLACDLARRCGATLRLVHVHALSPTPILVEHEPVIDENLVSRALEHEQLYMQQIKSKLCAAIGTDVEIAVEVLDRPLTSVVNEPLARFLAAYTATLKPDLVVMTTHGYGGFSRFWLGSVADTLIRMSHVPILLLRPSDSLPDFARPPLLKRMLIALDGSPLAEQILPPAFALGSALKADYTLLRVVEPFVLPGYRPLGEMYPPSLQATQAAQTHAQNYLERIAQSRQTNGGKIQTRVALAAQPASAILVDAQQHNSDLIALTTHARSGLQRLLLGSVADKVLHGATTPVLIYRPEN